MNNNLSLMNKRMNHARTMRGLEPLAANSSSTGLVRITNRHLQNYIEERGIEPVYEEYNVAYYRRSQKLREIMESFEIEFVGFRNKLS